MEMEQSKKYQVKLNLNEAMTSQQFKMPSPQQLEEKVQVQG